MKDEEEMEAMRRVSAIHDRALAEFKALLKEGVTEREVSNQIKEIYQRLGADDLSFPPSVCFGANAAIGHYRYMCIRDRSYDGLKGIILAGIIATVLSIVLGTLTGILFNKVKGCLLYTSRCV